MMLEFENVTGTKGKFKLDNVSFALPEGYIMGLAGANGAGKTTLIDYIMNEKKRYSGTITLFIKEHQNYCDYKIINSIRYRKPINAHLC